MIIDTQGFILSCCVGAASENDRDGVKVVLNKTERSILELRKCRLIWDIKAKI
ncbi:putative transposase [Wolbachia endosymbiont of Brugia pahangi]|nr:putative transposase [Wolbachia endosymbiont of Brugia pahangi]